MKSGNKYMLRYVYRYKLQLNTSTIKANHNIIRHVLYYPQNPIRIPYYFLSVKQTEIKKARYK